MHSVVQNNLAALKALCARYRVERLDLFGSAARDDFDPESSDLDFLVEFAPMSPREHADSFFGLLGDLERLFGRRIDLLEPEPIENPYLRASIERSRKALYEAA
ncbi:MAG TPA: nucleotidyltransferase domain-containing protein [Thermoanaerobaculia bacterium]|nr:nucleotidyltransferase domain-containing protein [Thermoanaerobaculia bacterium]